MQHQQTLTASHMLRAKTDKPEQRLSLQSVNGFEDRVFEAKVKAGPTRGQGQDHRILSSSSRSVLEDTIPGLVVTHRWS